jgi:hypothetical protein
MKQMSISHTEKEMLRKRTNIEIQKLKHNRDLLLDQKETVSTKGKKEIDDKIQAINAQILTLKQELENIERLPEKERDGSPIIIKGGVINQINTGINTGNVSQHDFTTSVDENIDFIVLAKELTLLRSEMKKRAKTDDHDIAIGEISKAEKAIKTGDKNKLYENLKAAGKWALDVATKIGTTIAAEMIKSAMGLR